MKKKNFFLVLMLLLGAAGMGYGASKLLPIEQPSSENPSSETSEDDSGEIINLNVIDRHILRAVNQTVTLTVTVLPENATDKTVVWSSSDTTKVSITGTTANTATIKCLQTFNGSVVITARATNGTSETEDDFVATCTCTFLIPIETLDLQFVSPGTTSFNVGQKVNVKVLFTPIDANEVYNITFNNTYLRNNGSYQSLGYSGEIHWYEFEVLANTPAATTTPITVTTVENSLSDSLSIYGGTHLGVDGLTLMNMITVDVTLPAGSPINHDWNYFDDAVSYNYSHPIGTTFKFNIPVFSFVQPQTSITFNTTYFNFVSKVGSGITETSPGVLSYSGVGGGSFTLSVKIGGAGAQYVAFDPQNYGSPQTLSFPFILKQPISGITIDIPEFDF